MPEWLRRLLFVTAGVLAFTFLTALGLVVLRYALVALLPFIIAVVFAALIEPLVRLFDRRLPRGLAVFLAMIVFFAVAGALVTLLVAHLVTELADISVHLPAYVGEARRILTDLIVKARAGYGALPPEAVRYLESGIEALTASVRHSLGTLISSLLGFLGSLPSAALVLVVSVLATYFISRDREKIGKLWARAVPAPLGTRMAFMGHEAVGAFFGYCRAQMVLVALTVVLSTAGLYILKVKYALSLGLVIGFFDLVPVLGPSTIFIPWIVAAFFAGAKVFSLKLLVLYVIVFAVRQLFEARIVAVSVGAHPLAIMVGMYAGLKLLGVGGLVLGPITVVLLQAAYRASTSRGEKEIVRRR
jgi:sporulation integral membrane protein YtvI